MPDYVLLKRLTEKTDLGWFRSVYTNRRLKGHQKGITLNKSVINPIWPDLRRRQSLYEAAKKVEKAARAPGGAGPDAARAERDRATEAAHLPIRVQIHGPASKPAIVENRLLTLADKNWRLDGAFIADPDDDPDRFDSALQEGDLALIGIDGIEVPTRAIVVLLAQSIDDAAIVADLSARVARGPGSMVRIRPDDLLELAERHTLPPDHIIRALSTDPVIEAALEEIAEGDIAAAAKIKERRPARLMTPEELAAGIVAKDLTGRRGEQMVDAWLAEQHSKGGPGRNWMWASSAAHPYDFELLDNVGAVQSVIDVKSTASVWSGDFFMSLAELNHAAESPVPYLIYRISEAGATGAWLRISSDIRSFARSVMSALAAAAIPGTRATTLAVAPSCPALTWSEPVRLTPVLP